MGTSGVQAAEQPAQRKARRNPDEKGRQQFVSQAVNRDRLTARHHLVTITSDLGRRDLRGGHVVCRATWATRANCVFGGGVHSAVTVTPMPCSSSISDSENART